MYICRCIRVHIDVDGVCAGYVNMRVCVCVFVCANV